MLGRKGLHLLFSALLFMGCQHDLDVPRPGDGPRPDVHADVQGPDAPIRDGPVADQPLKDAPFKEATVVDLGHEVQVPDLQLSDKLVVKDGTGTDQSLDLGAVLAKGSFSTGGPGSGGNMLLVESGFEVGERQCASTQNICVVGGITP